MGTHAHSDPPLFEHGPPMRVQRWLGLVRPNRLHVGRRALLVVLIGWFPIVVLTFAQVALQGGDGIASLLLKPV
jgi:hypothetical protein